MEGNVYGRGVYFRFFLIAAAAAFIVEFIIMFIIDGSPHDFQVLHIFIDASALTLAVTPLLYFLLYRPLTRNIKAKEEARVLLINERNRLETLTKNIGAGLTIISRDYKVTWANGIIRTIFGDVETKTCYSAFNKRDQVCPGCGVKQVFDTNADSCVHEQKGYDLNGNEVWSRIIATPVRDTEGNIIGVMEVVVPITELRKAEQELTESERRFRSMLEHVDMIAVTLDREGKVTFCNDHFAKVAGYSADEIVGVDWFDRFATDPGVRDVFKRSILDREIPLYHESFIITLTGERRLIAWNNTMLFGPDGNAIGAASLGQDITEAREAERLLRESEEKYHLLFDSVPLPLLLFDTVSLDILAVNRIATEQYGYSREEFLAMSIKDIRPAEDVGELLDTLKRKPEKGLHKVERIIRHRKRDGTIIHVEISAYDVMMGERTARIALIHDVTERLEATKRLKLEEDFFRDIVELTDAVHWKIDLATNRFTYVSPQAEKLLGYGPEEWIDFEFWASKLHPEDRERAVQYCMGMTKKGKSHDLEYRMVRADGSVVWLQDVAHVRSENGIPVMMNGMMFDITQRKEAEIALMQSEELFRKAFDDAGVGIALTSLDGRFIRVNDAYTRLVGYSIDELSSMNFSEITHPEDIDSSKKAAKYLMDGSMDKYSGEKRYVTKKGDTIWVLMNVSLMLDGEGKPLHFISQFQDITERKSIEAQLRQAQKMEAVGQLAGGVAHDFNNILTAIMGYGNIMQAGIGSGDPLRPCIDQIVSASKRASELTQGLLAFSRKQVISLKPVDLNDVIIGLRNFISRLIGEDIEIQLHLCDEQVVSLVDRGLIEQALVNIITNACDAMPDGGTLIIETRRVIVDDAFRNVPGFDDPGSYVQVSITDTGLGMDEETKSRLFEPFYTTKGEGKGTGLGMAMVYGTVKQHNGFINVSSQLNAGSTFELFLPLADDESKDIRRETSPSEIQGGTETILVAEDDAVVRELLQEILESHGYSVVLADNGEEAVAKYSELNGQIDMLILDVIMPRKRGPVAFEEIRAVNPSVKALFLSGHAEDLIRTRGMLDEGMNFIYKPVAVNDLLIKVRSILES